MSIRKFERSKIFYDRSVCSFQRIFLYSLTIDNGKNKDFSTFIRSPLQLKSSFWIFCHEQFFDYWRFSIVLKYPMIQNDCLFSSFPKNPENISIIALSSVRRPRSISRLPARLLIPPTQSTDTRSTRSTCVHANNADIQLSRLAHSA